MKKFRLFVVLSLMIGVLIALCSCGGEKLSTPTNVTVDIENQMVWDAVENARSYIVEIKSENGESKEVAPRKTTTSLSNLEEGDYEIRVKAVGDGEEYKDSDWTETLYFHKEYETGCVYTLINNNTEYAITKYGKAPDTIYIEDTYRNKPVTEISDKAFKGYSKIVNVYVGNNVKRIGEGAFQNCKKLEKIVLPDTVQTIGISAFQSCLSLKEINIPKSVTQIEENVFSYCRALETIELHDKITKIGMLGFSDCSGLKSITIPDSVTSIGEAAFTGNTSLETVKIGNGVTKLETDTFYMCTSLKNIVFPTSGKFTTIGKNVFADCIALEEVEIPEGVETIDSWAFAMQPDEHINEETQEVTYTYKSMLESVSVPETTTRIGQHAFYGTKFYADAIAANADYIYADNWLVACSDAKKKNLVEINVQSLIDDVVGIADNVFFEMEKLEEVVLPYTVKYIGNGAFAFNKNLFKVDISNVEIIGDQAFYDCSILNKLTLGMNLKRIGAEAFALCDRVDSTELTQIIPDSVTSIGTNAFYGTQLWKKVSSGAVYAGNWVVGFQGTPSVVELEEGTKGIADYAFYKCSTLTLVDGLEEVEYIGRAAFMNCERLDQVELGNNIKEIKDYTFYGCSSLYSIELPRKLTRIGRSAFYKCSQLSEIDLTRTDVTEIGPFAFYSCPNLKEVNLGDTVTSIGDRAFYKCEAIEEVVIPNTVTVIGEKTFYQCAKLKNLTLGNSVVSIGEYAFTGCVALERLSLPTSLKTLGNYSFFGCTELTSLSLGEGIKSIGDFAFYSCAKITNLYIPESLKNIGKYAFKGCEGITSLVMPKTVETMGAHAFYGCKYMTVYTDATAIQGQWQKFWNSMRRPTVWGCELSEDKTYVVSVVVAKGTFENGKIDEFGAPKRRGYIFKGWATEEGGEVVYSAKTAETAPVGTTLYAVWSDTLE